MILYLLILNLNPNGNPNSTPITLNHILTIIVTLILVTSFGNTVHQLKVYIYNGIETLRPVLRRFSSPRTKLLAARCECLHLIKINGLAL